MDKINLGKFIKGEKYLYLNNFNINITKVELIRKDMKLFILANSDKILDNKVKKDIESLFRENLEGFSISIDINYNIDFKETKNIDDYIKSIKNLILTTIPSSSSWIKNLNFKIQKDSFLLVFPNEMSLISMRRNGFIQELSDKVYLETKYKLDLTVEEIKKDEQFLKDKYIEEKEISKKTLIESESQIQTQSKSVEPKENYSFGKTIKDESIDIKSVNLQSGNVVVKGEIFDINSREIKGNKLLITFYISDGTESIQAKTFLKKDEGEELLLNISEGTYLLINGDVVFDNYSKSQCMMLKSLKKIKKFIRMDNAKEKRIELHMHTKMSSMDGIASVEKIANRAKYWGHKAVAITDHGVLQAFPEAMEMSKKLDLKFIYGLEGYLVNDNKRIIDNYDSDRDYNEYIVFDIETTGLSAINDEITEIGAVKLKDGKVVDEFSQLVNPRRPIPEFITNLTGITDAMVRDKPFIEDVIYDFKEFIKDSVLVAHNASFDVGFIREKLKLINSSLNNPILDTLELARSVFPNLKNHKLNNIAKYLDVELLNHHRAVDDAVATKDILLKILDLLNEKGIISFDQINNLKENKNMKKDRVYHIVLLAKNKVGLKNLYRIVSKSHLDYFHRKPRIPKSLITKNREGLIIGSACEAGELYKAILNGSSDSDLRSIVKFYDYLEIQPLDNNAHLIRNGILKDREQLKDINRQIYELGEKGNRLVVATGDVHFLDPEDEIYRRILMSGQGFNDADSQPPLYFKTTDEMLDEFSYLGKDKSYEVVVKNTNLINDMIEDIYPIPDGTYPPVIEGSEEELKDITYKKAYDIYGDPLPKIVKDRLDRELDSIIKNGYAVMYIIAQKLVWKSLEDGYLVGSRGSVGSSFVATMSGITEVNPLAPHYVCPNCKYSEFFEDGKIASGSDLEDKKCPKCDSDLTKDGHNIPFEVFLGFEGDKEPDIDLNFAGEYQSVAHKYTEELFGEGYVFRAGTIGTIAGKTAYGFVKKYFESKEINISQGEINRLLRGCTGIKRTSGQHPGGVMIVPKHKDILDFSPIQYPANDKKSGVITTHFDYNAISSNILKLDILGHDTPTIIRMLEDITGVDSLSIPLDEPSTIKIFTSTKPLKITKEDIKCPVGTLGIPEFGTKFVRQMLVDTKPNTFSELVRISGLSHGTDVWLNNAQDLVRNNMAKLAEVISTREDIMLYLIDAGLDKQKSFRIMENVRKGRGLSKEDEESMRSLDLPPWYIDSCNKIKYMFPKAHAVAYVMMSFRIAYYKVHYPLAFYSTYFTIKASDFDAQLILKGVEALEDKIIELENMGNDITTKEKNLHTVMEVAREMYKRGFGFQKVDLYKSHSDKFLIDKNTILPPLKSLDGVGENAARNIMHEREKSKFISIEDLVKRTRVSKTVIEALINHGCLNGLPESNQISLFSI